MNRAAQPPVLVALVLLLALGLVACSTPRRVAAPSQVLDAPLSLRARGTELLAIAADGSVLGSRALVGATLRIDDQDVVLDDVRTDPRARGGEVLLHRFVVVSADGRRTPLCAPAADGTAAAFPVPDERGGFQLTCTSGAIGKCVRWGYRPWEEREGGPPMRALHQACMRMVRADYGGDGATATRDGTMIAYCDRSGVNPCHGRMTALEAGWSPDGAVCVARPRIADLTSLPELTRRYPRLVDHVGAACTATQAFRDGALLVNR